MMVYWKTTRSIKYGRKPFCPQVYVHIYVNIFLRYISNTFHSLKYLKIAYFQLIYKNKLCSFKLSLKGEMTASHFVKSTEQTDILFFFWCNLFFFLYVYSDLFNLIWTPFMFHFYFTIYLIDFGPLYLQNKSISCLYVKWIYQIKYHSLKHS